MCDGIYRDPCDCETETVGLPLLTLKDHQRIQDQECQEGKNRVQRSGWVYQFFCGCFEELPQTGWLKTTELFFPFLFLLEYSCFMLLCHFLCLAK